jgi:hypothetical protein
MNFNANEIRKLSESKRPAAEAEERRRREEEAVRVQREEMLHKRTIEEIENRLLQNRLNDVQRAIEQAAQAGKRVCQYSLGERGVTRCHGYHSLFGYKRSLSRRHLDSTDKGVYDWLRARGFSVEISNVNAKYPNSYWYAMIISW